MDHRPRAELEDLRGGRLSWVVGRCAPLHCAFRASAGSGGHIVPSLEDASLLAVLAGVRWRILHERFYDAVEFESGPKIAEARVWAGGHGYEAEIDGVARYRFIDRKEGAGQKAWIDEAERTAVVFAPHGVAGPITSGEIVVSAWGAVEHLPILVLLGVVHLSGR